MAYQVACSIRMVSPSRSSKAPPSWVPKSGSSITDPRATSRCGDIREDFRTRGLIHPSAFLYSASQAKASLNFTLTVCKNSRPVRDPGAFPEHSNSSLDGNRASLERRLGCFARIPGESTKRQFLLLHAIRD